VDGLIEQRRISLEIALSLLAHVRDEAMTRGLSLAAAVVDDGGHIVASQRMDGAALGAMQLAVGKAYTSVLWGAATGDFMQSTQPGGDDWGWNSTDSRIVVYAGGVPLFVGGALVGGVGASGATAAEDEACVRAAARSAGFDE
jgi:glc operon protein GlcG